MPQPLPPGRYPFALARGWTALFVTEVPGDVLLLLADGQVVEVVLEPDEVPLYLAALTRAAASPAAPRRRPS
jgi:hypothetical protein